MVDAVHVDGRRGVHIHGHTQTFDVLVDGPEFFAVQGLLVDVGEDIDALEAQLVHAAVNLGDGAFGAAPAQCGPSLKLAGVGLNHLGQVVVDARGPVVGLEPAQQLGARHAVAEDRHTDVQVFHVLELLVDVGVDDGRGVLVAAGAANEIGPAPQYALGQGTASRQVLQIG